jgi:amino acid transporter
MAQSEVVPEKKQLRKNHLSFTDTIAQSFANIAPTATPALAIPLVAASAGNGTWLTFLIVTVGLILVGLCISVFAQKYASSGALYTYVSKGLGASSGFLTGWGLILAYLFTAMATLIALGIFGNLLFEHMGLHIPNIVFYAVGAALIWFLAYRDIRLSSILALILEIISVSLIAIVGIVVLVSEGFRIDIAQFSLKGVTFAGIQTAMVLGVFSFVGFESAATLGGESRNPYRTIPRAVIMSTAIVGLFFAGMSYVEVLGFPTMEGLTGSGAPLDDMSTSYGMKWFIPIVEFGALLSFFSCSLASVNAASRVMYAMSRDRIFLGVIGTAHSTNQTPHIAVTISSLLNFIVPVSLMAINPVTSYGYVGTIATYGFLVAYILVSIAAPVYMAKNRQLSWKPIVTGVGGLLFMAIPLVGTFYPVPDAPYNVMPYFFIGYLLLGWIYFAVVRRSQAGAGEIQAYAETRGKETA